MDELKPCPFCGGEAEHRSVTDAEGSVFYETGCGNDSCCAWRAAQASTPQASISAWNARHEPCMVASDERIKADERAVPFGWVNFIGELSATKKNSDDRAVYLHPPARAAQVAQGEAVAKVRHFDYRGIARNDFSQEAQMLDGAPVLPDGTLLYTAPPAQPVERAAVTMHIGAPAAEPVAQGEAVIDAKYDNVLVPFARLMAKELHANAGKGDRPGWLSMTPAVGMLEIYYHAAKLQKSMKDSNGDGIREYAADVANMAMMLLDVCGGLAVTDSVQLGEPAVQREAAAQAGRTEADRPECEACHATFPLHEKMVCRTCWEKVSAGKKEASHA